MVPDVFILVIGGVLPRRRNFFLSDGRDGPDRELMPGNFVTLFTC